MPLHSPKALGIRPKVALISMTFAGISKCTALRTLNLTGCRSLTTLPEGDSCFCPYLLDTPSNASIYMSNIDCTEISTNTYNLESNQEKKVLKIIDIFGREVAPKKNMILFYIYNDQSVKKIIIK